MADFSGLLLKVIKNKEGKEKYLLYAIKEKWQEIVGEAAAKHDYCYRCVGWKGRSSLC